MQEELFYIERFEPPLETLFARYEDLLQRLAADSVDDETLHEAEAVAAAFDECASIICYEQGSLLRWADSKLRRASVMVEPEVEPLIEYVDVLEAGKTQGNICCREAKIAYLKWTYKGLQKDKKSIKRSKIHPKIKQAVAELVNIALRIHPMHTSGNLEEYDNFALSFYTVLVWRTCRQIYLKKCNEEYACITALDPVQMHIRELIGEDPMPPAVYPAAVDALAESDPERFKSKYRSALSNYLQMDRLASEANPEYEIYSPKNRKTGKRHKWIVLLESDLWKEHHPDPLGSMRSKADVERVVIERDTVNRLLAQGCRDELDRNIVALRLQDPNLDLSDIAEILGKPHDLIRQRWSRLRRRASKLFSA